MPAFSKNSLEKIETIHPDLQKLLKEVIKEFDITIIEGQRSISRQFELFKKGRVLVNGKWILKDKSKWRTNCDGIEIKGKHNYNPSLAVDIAPYPISWKPEDEYRFKDMGKIVKAIAKKLNINIVWGGDWTDKHIDLPHFELKGDK